jgi:hypothetical protein
MRRGEGEEARKGVKGGVMLLATKIKRGRAGRPRYLGIDVVEVAKSHEVVKGVDRQKVKFGHCAQGGYKPEERGKELLNLFYFILFYLFSISKLCGDVPTKKQKKTKKKNWGSGKTNSGALLRQFALAVIAVEEDADLANKGD